MTAVILDLDGTLVDSVPLHVLCWQHAFAANGHVVPTQVLHRAIGLGSDRLVPHVLGEVPPEAVASALIEAHRERFLDAAEDLHPTPGAADLLADLAGRGVSAVIATSAGGDERAALMGVLDDPAITVIDAVDRDSKPAPDLLRSALVELGMPPGPDVLMVGDSPWDGYAATRAGIGFVAVRSGGFPEADLRRSGARLVAEDPAGLLGLL